MSDEYLYFSIYLYMNLCTSFVLSSDLVQSLPLRSITIWQSIFSTSLFLNKSRQKLSFPLNHLVNFFNIERHVLHVLAPLNPSVGINPF